MRHSFPSLLITVALLASSAWSHFEIGQMYVIDFQNSKVYYVNTQTWSYTVASASTALANNPGAIGFSHHGHMLLANYGDNTVIDLDGQGGSSVVLTAADGLAGPWGPSGVVIGPGHGDIYVTNINNTQIMQYTEDYSTSAIFADATDGLEIPAAIAFLADGHMLVSDRGPSHMIHHFDSVTGMAMLFDTLPEQPVDIAVRVNRDIYVLTDMGNIYRYPGGVASSRVLLGNYGAPSSTGGLDFSYDHDFLYHVCTTDGAVREIDPDTGAAVVKLTLPGQPISLALVGSQYAPGSYFHFGNGLAGTGGVEPTLEGQGEPRLGHVSQINAFDYVGGSTVWLFLSATQGKLPFKGGTLYVDLGAGSLFWPLPTGGTPGVAGDGDVSLPVYMPNDPILYGTKTYMQGLAIDPAAVQGVSFSPCLVMYIGW